MRTNWVTNKQTADGFLRAAAVEGARTAELRGRAPPSTAPPLADGSCSPHNRCRGIACHVRECVVFVRFLSFVRSQEYI